MKQKFFMHVMVLLIAAVVAAPTFAAEVLTVKSGNVGINASTPAWPLDVRDTDGGVAARVFGGEFKVQRTGAAPPAISFQSDIRTWSFTTSTVDGLFGIRDATAGVTPLFIRAGAPSSALVINANGSFNTATGALLSVGGVWTNASSRDLKRDIEGLSGREAMEALDSLEPVKYRYKNGDEPYVGFIAEDVPELVATSDRAGLASMDIVAVLTKVVKEQQSVIAELSAKVERLEQNSGQ